MIFAHHLTREEFIAWWGADNLPCDLQVITWTGWSISADSIESLYLWNPSANFPAGSVAQVFTGSFAQGVSKLYDTNAYWMGGNSVVGERGTLIAVQGGDIGSPGYDAAPTLDFLTCGGITQDEAGIQIKGRSVVGRTYVLQFKNDLQDSDWSELDRQPATNAAVLFRDGPLVSNRFYRLQELP